MRFTRAKNREYIVVSVGGSLVVPDSIDTAFLTSFRSCILDHVARGFSFYIVVGGGRTARNFQAAAQEVRGDLCREDMDWLGIHSTRLNAHLMRTLFKEHAQAKVVKNPLHHLRGKAPIIIGAGWRPGWSTDYCAVLAAKKLGAKRIVNLSNIDYVYDKDPRSFPDAKKFESLPWSTFRTLIPDHWDPGLSSPFDPVAAEAAEQLGLEVAIINGAHLGEFEKYLGARKFRGTIISPTP